MATKAQVENVLKEIPDPEIGVSILDLGLVYEITIAEKTGTVRILMTLTSIGCPLFDQIAIPIRKRVGKLKGVKKVDVDLTFDPPWSTEKMSDEAKEQLGFNL
jgi:metal-sulfur cluster biosynthetic enzyme